jgi:alpha-methylacyl-CoA racemase
MAVGALEPQFYAIFLEKIGLSEDEFSQFDNFEKSHVKFTEIFKTKTQNEWCKIFDGSDACVTPVLNFDNVASHPHNSSQNSFTLGKDNLVIPNPAPRLSKTPGVSCSTKSPNIISGKHTMEILVEYQYTPKKIKEFIDNNVVACSETTSKL